MFVNEPRAISRLKQQFEQNPLLAIAVIGATARGLGKFIEACSGIRSRNAYARRSKR